MANFTIYAVEATDNNGNVEQLTVFLNWDDANDFLTDMDKLENETYNIVHYNVS